VNRQSDGHRGHLAGKCVIGDAYAGNFRGYDVVGVASTYTRVAGASP
jgi:hypothetical protein